MVQAPRDEEILEKVRKHMLGCVEDGKQVNGSYMFLETAGGVHSPAMSGMVYFLVRGWGGITSNCVVLNLFMAI